MTHDSLWSPADGDQSRNGEFPRDDREPAWWQPGDPIQTPHGRYTRQQALAAVGPGWATLAGHAWDAATAAGARVVQVKEELGCLVIYWRDVEPEGEPVLRATLGVLAAESVRTCEACSAPGRRWTHETAPSPLPGRPSHTSARWLTLCDGCAWRFYAEGATTWTGIAGQWSPESGPSDEGLDA